MDVELPKVGRNDRWFSYRCIIRAAGFEVNFELRMTLRIIFAFDMYAPAARNAKVVSMWCASSSFCVTKYGSRGGYGHGAAEGRSWRLAVSRCCIFVLALKKVLNYSTYLLCT